MKPDDQSNLPSHSRLATRSSMIFDLKEFSEERWNNFVLVYTPLLKFWIRKKNVPSAAEDDVLQEALQSIFAGIGNFERDAAKGKFRGWLRHESFSTWTSRRSTTCETSSSTSAAASRPETPTASAASAVSETN